MNVETPTTEITVADLQRKALHIRDMTEVEARAVVEERAVQMIAVGAIAILVAVSFAYYLGSRRRA